MGFLIYKYMNYIKKFESFQNQSILVIVDVQKSFSKFFSEMYLNELKKYCKEFDIVYQIFDNHVDGKNVDKDYLYDDNPQIPIHDDLYHFPNQTELIEKRYNYDVDADFYKNILDKKTYNIIKEKENKNTLKKGELFPTKEGTMIVYIGNNHKWFHIPVKLYNLLKTNKGKTIYIVGGSDSECLEDICITCKSLGINVKRDHRYIYSASHCPIK
jgi:hypothetical protein